MLKIPDAKRSLAGGAPVRRTWIAVGGGVLGAVGAASCCIAPLLLFSLGISGAWIGNLTALAPYQPLFVGLAAIALIFGFIRVYARPEAECEDGSYCAKPASKRLLKIALWFTTVLVLAAVSFPYVAVYFL